MKNIFLVSFVYVLVLGVSLPGVAAAFSLIDEQPLFSAQQTESGLAQFTKYPTWLRPSLEKAGWIKRGQTIDAKTSIEIEVRLCREFAGGTDAECRNPEASAALFVISALSQFTSLDRKTAPDTLLTSPTIKKVVADRIQQVTTKKRTPCTYSLLSALMGVCAAIDLGTQSFPGVTKTTATKYVRSAEARYQELLSQISQLDREKRAAYEKELASVGLAQDLKSIQTAVTKKKYTEAYLAALTFGWTMESVTIQLQKYLDKRSPVSADMVAERKKLYEREMARFQQQHLVRGNDSAYLLRYSLYARNVRNYQEAIASPSFALLRTDEQLGIYDISLDLMSLIDLGAQAKI